MAETNMEAARTVYQTLCDAIDARNWNYDRDEEKLLVHFVVSGDDIPMQFILIVDAERELIRLISPLPFKMEENKRMEGAIAACSATYGLADGNFDYDLSDGEISFRLTASYKESLIGEGLFQYMISLSCAMVDQYNDKFLALNKGHISLADFIAEG